MALNQNAPQERHLRSHQGIADTRFLNAKAWSLRWSDRTKSRDLAKQAVQVCKAQPVPDVIGIGLAMRTLAWQAKWAGAFEEAQTYCLRAKSRLSPRDQPTALADVQSILGVLHYSRGRRDLAMAATLNGLDLIRNINADSTHIDLLTTLATIERYNGNMFEAYESLQTARGLSRRAERARVDHNFARCLEQDNNPHRAVGYAMRSVIGARRHDNRVVLPYALEVLGTALGQVGRTEMAMTYLEEGLAIAVADNDNRARCQILEQIGQSLELQENIEEALSALRRGLKMAEKLEYPVWQRKFLRRIAEIERNRGQHDEAVIAYARLVELMEAERV